jgi:hypothetical protein
MSTRWLLYSIRTRLEFGGIVGTWHKVDAKHLPAYLDEMCFRFNNRKTPYLFRDTLIKLINTPNLEYKELTAQMAEPAA